MPYVALKVYPKDPETEKKLSDKIYQDILDIWGCPPQAIHISLEEVAPEDWNEKVREPEIDTKLDKMLVLDGVKKY